MTLSDQLRAHALGPRGGDWFSLHLVSTDLCQWLVYEDNGEGRFEVSCNLTPTERRMFILFVAEAIES